MSQRITPRINGWLASIGIIIVVAFAVVAARLFAGSNDWRTVSYSAPPAVTTKTDLLEAPPAFIVTHLSTPEPVKAIYMTSWVAGTVNRRRELVKLIEDTELNAIVIDIKDYTGRIAFAVDDPVLVAAGAVENRIGDIKEFIATLHARGIYVIGRISVFQDLFLAHTRPELAVRRASDGAVWRDRKGIAWLEPGATEAWDYAVRLARASYAMGFDELNFDYIRFPSDGDMTDIAYRYFDSAHETRVMVMTKFFAYLKRELADLPAPLSIDLFGLTTTSADDLGIGQMLLAAAPYFDYIAPMVYPSHFASGYLGLPNPAAHPYEVVRHAMSEAGKRLTATTTPGVGTTTPVTKKSFPLTKLRPWLQDFDLGADYTAEMVRAQIKATYDAGLTSWMIWSPSNRYTTEALDKI